MKSLQVEDEHPTVEGDDMMVRSLLGMALLVSVLACDNEAPLPSTAFVDSAGVPVVLNPRPASQAASISLSEQPIVVIGDPERGPGHELFRVGSGTVLQDGTIVLANDGTSELRFYDETGTYVRSAGRRGEGPGEFLAISLIDSFRGDSLLAWDLRQRRFTVFAPDGSFARSFQAPPGIGFGFSPVGALSDGGAVLLRSEMAVGDPSATTTVERRPSVVMVLDPSGDVQTELGPFPGVEMSVVIRDGGPSAYAVVFGRSIYARAREDRIAVGNNDAYSIRLYGADGSVAKVVRQVYEPVSVQTGDFDRALPEPLRPDAPPSPFKDQFGSNIAQMPRHETFPAFGSQGQRAFRFDQVGNLWVLEYQMPWSDASSWHVFDEEGVFLGRVDLPERARWLDAGDDWVLLRLQDDLDVETVALFELTTSDLGSEMGSTR